jgi:hypothetical protein
MILGDKRLVSEVVLSHLRTSFKLGPGAGWASARRHESHGSRSLLPK